MVVTSLTLVTKLLTEVLQVVVGIFCCAGLVCQPTHGSTLAILSQTLLGCFHSPWLVAHKSFGAIAAA